MLPSAEPVLQPLRLPWLAHAHLELAILRLDLVDPELSGNKWFKLRRHLAQAREDGATGLISLGGAHSNHLHALAAAGRRFGLATVGLLCGHEQDTPTVRDLHAFGMQLHWLGHTGYRARHQAGFWDPWRARYPHHQPVPEGGGGLDGALGCAALVARLQAQLPTLGWADYHGWWLAAGTGTTLAGLVIGEAGRHEVCGALAGPFRDSIGRQVGRLLGEAGLADRGYRLVDAGRRGFGRIDEPLARFLVETERQTGVPLEPVYTAKALLALRAEVEVGRFPSGTRLIFVHTGGLQGRRAAEPQLQRLLRL